MEQLFKSLGKIFETDFINRCWIKTFPDGRQEEYTLEDWHAEVAMARLNRQVPEQIQEQFETAKNVLLYSWFSYRLRMVALLYSFSVVENALRERLGYKRNDRRGLKRLLTEAIERRFLNDSGFHIPKVKATVVWEERRNDGIVKKIEYSHIPEEDLKQSVEYIEGLCQAIPRLRNSLAHGKNCLFPEVLTPIIVHSEIINMLFNTSSDGVVSAIDEEGK
ncbi:MAG: hypothetical protein ABIF19_13600 [Planctomycetota bacterium]